MQYPFITQTKYQIRISFLREHARKKGSTSLEKEFDENGEWIRKEKALQDALRRAKRAIIDYALNNDFTHFGTITINSAWHNIDSAESQVVVLDKLLCALDHYRQNVSSDFRYLICPEYGEKKGRLHFHFLVKGIDKEDLFLNNHRHLDWLYMKERFGHVQITKIGDTVGDHQRTAFYCSKYITKDNLQLRSHRYFCSKDLKKSEKFCMDAYEYTVAFKDWLEMQDFQPYYKDDRKKILSYSLHPRVFWDMLEACGILCSRKHGVVLYEGFESCYIQSPFDRCYYDKEKSRCTERWQSSLDIARLAQPV